MVKTKKGGKGQPAQMNATEAVSRQPDSSVQLNGTPAQGPEFQVGLTPPVEEFDMGIRELAYFKWEAAGFPPGDGFDFWLEAERELKASRTAGDSSAERL